MRLAVLSAVALLAIPAAPAWSHPGGLNGEGCHNNRRTGDYHCHGGGRASSRSAARSRGSDRPLGLISGSGGGAPAGGFANCRAARAAGAAPVRRGQPGYARRLDRDGDGVGCE